MVEQKARSEETMRFLVVEDEKSLREDIAKKLRLSGYEAEIALLRSHYA